MNFSAARARWRIGGVQMMMRFRRGVQARAAPSPRTVTIGYVHPLAAHCGVTIRLEPSLRVLRIVSLSLGWREQSATDDSATQAGSALHREPSGADDQRNAQLLPHSPHPTHPGSITCQSPQRRPCCATWHTTAGGQQTVDRCAACGQGADWWTRAPAYPPRHHSLPLSSL